MTRPDRVHPVLVSAYEQFAASKARGTDPAAGRSFDPTASPLYGRAVFLVGSPRSGTTWLQQLLLLHPSIATAGEMHVFCEGVGALFDNHDGDDPHTGLSGWVTRPELVAAVRVLVDDLMTTLRDATRPAATHVLDKTPNHVPYAARLAEVYPDAAFVQIIRDGRDSVASAHDLWSWSSDYAAPAQVAARWRDAVLDCRTHLSHLRYHEVRYEDLLADTTAGLARIYDVIGLPYDDDFLRESAEFGRTPLNLRPSRTDVSARKWSDLPLEMEREIYVAAGDLLVELGYVERAHVDTVLAHRSVQRTVREGRDAAERQARRVARRVLRRGRRPDQRSRRSAEHRAAARGLVEGVTRGAADLAAVLPDGSVLIDGGERLTAATEIADRLVTALDGARLLRIEADDRAAVVRLTQSAGRVEMMRITVDRDGELAEIALTRRG
jgi:hypothetical protein